MDTPDFIIRGPEVVLPDGQVAPASIHVRAGRIAAVGPYTTAPAACPVVAAGPGTVVMPGLVDTHVHINEPGRTNWEGFATATRAAAAGGVTTLVEMPLNSIPATTTHAHLMTKLAAAAGQLAVDVAFWGGVVPGNTAELARLHAAGVVGFKCFLVPSGVDEFPHVTAADLRVAMPELARLGALLIVHAELPAPIDAALAATAAQPADPRRYETFLQTRPKAAEDEAVALMIELCRATGARVHIVHHSSANSLPLIQAAQAEGLPFTAETCPHYLLLTAEDVPVGATEFKCCPPIRERANLEALWAALAAGTIGLIVSDHSPCPPELKLPAAGDFLQAWGGISSLQLRLPLVWTEARRRGHTLSQVCEWLAGAPARLAGLAGRKGALSVGCDADIIIWRPDETWRIDPAALAHRHKLTPYAGRMVQGTVETTFLRGVKVYDRGEFAATPAGAPLLLRGTA